MPPVSKAPFFLALLAGLASYLLPYGQWMAYPFTLFVTLLHEGGHVAMALLTGSQVASMAIAPDGSGLTLTLSRGYWPGVLIANAGYLSATAYGTAILRMANRRGECRGILKFSALLVAALVAFFTVFVNDWASALTQGGAAIGIGMKLFTILAGASMVAALWLAAQAESEAFVAFIANWLGIEAIFNSLADIKTVLALAAYSNAHSDARNLAELTGIPALAWALSWGALALLIVGSTFRAVLRGK